MAFQLEVIRFRDQVPIQAIPRFIPGLDNLTLELKGQDFRNADQVIVNEVPAPEFIIVDQHTLFVQLPDAAQEQISSVEVISSGFTLTSEASKIQFQVGPKTRKVDGILKLIQLFVKWILQTPGSDLFNPERGGGLQEIAGKLTATRNMQPVLASITRSVNATVTQIRAAQANVNGLPASERLLAADIVSMNVFDKDMEARLRVRISSVAGRDALTSILL